MKEKEEEKTLFMNKYLHVNAYQSYYNTLIREERNNVHKETKECKEKWKDQVAAKQKHQDV